LGFSFNISATARTSDFKCGMQLEFAKAHHKNHTQKEGWAWPWARELPEILWFHFNIYTITEASEFKFGTP